MKVESTVGKIAENEEKVFAFLSDFRNLESLVPKENLISWEFKEDHCKLGIAGIGEIELKLVEKEPYRLIKWGSGSDSAYSFTLWIQLKQTAEKDTRARITLQAELNPFLQVMAKNPLQKFVNTLVDQMATIHYS